MHVDFGVLSSILGVGAFCFGIIWFFKSHAVKYDESHERNRVEHEKIIETLAEHTKTNAALVTATNSLNKSVKKALKRNIEMENRYVKK